MDQYIYVYVIGTSISTYMILLRMKMNMNIEMKKNMRMNMIRMNMKKNDDDDDMIWYDMNHRIPNWLLWGWPPSKGKSTLIQSYPLLSPLIHSYPLLSHSYPTLINSYPLLSYLIALLSNYDSLLILRVMLFTLLHSYPIWTKMVISGSMGFTVSWFEMVYQWERWWPKMNLSEKDWGARVDFKVALGAPVKL